MLRALRRSTGRAGLLIAGSALICSGATAEQVVAGSVPADAPPAMVRYAAPLPEPLHVLTPFDAAATRYGPGHRGVDVAAAQGAQVRAAAAGIVVFAGHVAGREVIVLRHRDGISTEYEPVHPLVMVGASVDRGRVLGTVDGHHGSCPGASCLHWGARRAGSYLDPLDLLRPLGPIRLVPPH